MIESDPTLVRIWFRPTFSQIHASEWRKKFLQQPCEAKLQTRGSMLPIDLFRYMAWSCWWKARKTSSVLRTWYTLGSETASDVIKVLPGKRRNRMRHRHHGSCFHSKRAYPFMLHSICIANVLVHATCVAGFTKFSCMINFVHTTKQHTTLAANAAP